MVETKERLSLPLIAVRGIVIYPQMVLHFDVARKKSISALESAMAQGQEIFLVAQKEINVEVPKQDDLYTVGTVARIKQLLKLPGNTVRVLVEGLYRAKVIDIFQTAPHDVCEFAEVKSKGKRVPKIEIAALKQAVIDVCEKIRVLNPALNAELIDGMEKFESISQFADSVASAFLRKVDQRQSILEELNTYTRLTKLLTLLTGELEVMEAEQDILKKVKIQMDKNQKDYFLREQQKAIAKELGSDEDEIAEYSEKIENSLMSEEIKEKMRKELMRLEKAGSHSADAGVMRNYLDTLLDMPFGKYTSESTSLSKVSKILERDHYGLKKVKERIIEYLSVKILTGSLDGQIICLAGPPGVGKTSIAKSIAEALGRNYVRISLGGIRDEAEIRGHRKTYIGAMPGRIASGIRQAGSMNPLFLLDEIDKLSRDSHGDPSSALLEVLDSQQNFSFRDHYLEVPLDLSKVMFLTTANNVETIPAPLLDRMEIIDISGYTSEEKEHIAIKHLIPDSLKKHGLDKNMLKISKDAVLSLILYYTREAGVRKLKREIDTLCRKAAGIYVKTKKCVNVNAKNISDFLGKKKYHFDTLEGKGEIGIARGLAWTAVGGDTLSIEVSISEGSGKLELTGNLGDVMKESAKAAVTYIRANAHKFPVNKNFYKECDIHIHVPEGATPKDGPSAGITICTATLSALAKKEVPSSVAMTGEITITGKVLPVGGICEKVLAAYRYGVNKIILPEDNRADLDEVPETVKKDINFVFVNKMDSVAEEIFGK